MLETPSSSSSQPTTSDRQKLRRARTLLYEVHRNMEMCDARVILAGALDDITYVDFCMSGEYTEEQGRNVPNASRNGTDSKAL